MSNTENPSTLNLIDCMLAEGARLKKFEGDHSFLNFCRKYDIIRLYGKRQRQKEAFESCLDGYTNFDCMRTPRGTAQRGSGGLTVFVKKNLVNNNIIRRIFTDMSECVVLLMESIFNDGMDT